jgi:hypothetical protein
MKLKNALIAVAAQLLLAGGAYAQTCTPSAGTLIDSPPSNVTVNTCSSTDQLASLCNASTPIGNAPDTIFAVQIGAGATGSITVTPGTYDAYVALLSGTCTGGSTCARETDNPGNVAETVSASGLAAGSYFLLITSFAASGNCGSTGVVVTPTLPVTLQNFSVN